MNDTSSEQTAFKFKNQLLSNICFVLGFASIIGSIAIWFMTGGNTEDTQLTQSDLAFSLVCGLPLFSSSQIGLGSC